MSASEQRLRAYYKRYARAYYGQRDRLFLRMARLFKMPVREIKDILGVERKEPWPSPLPPGCALEHTGDCLGRVGWVWTHTYGLEPHWEARCSVHYNGWEYWKDLYPERWHEILEERHKRGEFW